MNYQHLEVVAVFLGKAELNLNPKFWKEVA